MPSQSLRTRRTDNRINQRWAWRSYFLGLILAIPGQVYAARVNHNQTEALVLLVVGTVLFTPLLVTSSINIHRIQKDLQRLEIQIVAELTVLRILKPAAYKKLTADGHMKEFTGESS